MKITPLFAGLLVAAATLSLSARMAGAEPCTGPFVSCANMVQAICSRDADGTQRMTYKDFPAKTIQFEKCVGGIFEAAGHPNPYKTGVTTYGDLTVPYTELIYPQMEP